MADASWLLFLPQAPATSSSLRVLIWRHLRAAGAITLQNGVWVLPQTEAQLQFLQSEAADITRQGGTATIFTAQPLDLDLPARFNAERDQEYREVIERAQALLAELVRESAHGNFTYAELEENEQEGQKLAAWHAKVTARDFCGAPQAAEAARCLAEAQTALRTFTHAVYAQEGLNGATEATPPTLPPEEDQP